MGSTLAYLRHTSIDLDESAWFAEFSAAPSWLRKTGLKGKPALLLNAASISISAFPSGSAGILQFHRENRTCFTVLKCSKLLVRQARDPVGRSIRRSGAANCGYVPRTSYFAPSFVSYRYRRP